MVIWVYDVKTALLTPPKTDTYCIWVYEGSLGLQQCYIDQFSSFLPINYTVAVEKGSPEFVGYLEKNRDLPILWCVCQSGYIKAPAVAMAAALILRDEGTFSDVYNEYQDSYDRPLLWKLHPY